MTAPTSPELPAGRVVVDPRFRARRIAVRRDAGRRRLKRLLALTAVAATALAAVLVLKSPVLDVDDIAVSGARNSDAAAVVEAAGIDLGEPLLLADLDGARRRIEAMPWVRSVEVSRDLPGGVRVRVVEREPAAIVSAGGRAVLVDRSGRVLDDATDPGSHTLVAVVAGQAPPAVGTTVDHELSTAIDIAARLHQNPRGAVRSVRHDPTLSLHLVDGGRVELGDATDLDDKIEAFRTVFARVDRSCLQLLDVRVPTHPVLTRSRACS